MLRLQIRRVPPVWLFIIGLLLASFTCQTAARFLSQELDSTIFAKLIHPPEAAGSPLAEGTAGDHLVEPVLKPTPPEPNHDQAQTRGGVSNAIAVETLPEVTVSPEVKPLMVTKQGFGQDEREVAYAFLVKNADAAAAVAGSEVQVKAYDAASRVIATDSDYITIVLPGQTLGIAGNLSLEEEIPVAKLIVQIKTGQPYFFETMPVLDVKGIKYRPGQYYDRVTGLIDNSAGRDLEDLRVSAIAYDKVGDIVGAGYTFVSFLLADSSTGVDITLSTRGLVDKVELYPRLSFFTNLESAKQRPAGADDLSIQAHGFAQAGIEVGYGFLAENTNETFAVKDSEYRMTTFDDRGDVIAVDEGYIKLLLPGQIFGIGGTFYVEEGEEADHVDLQLKSGNYQSSSHLSWLVASNIEVSVDDSSTTVTGEILNPNEQALEDIWVTAVAYDEMGQIVGGGFTWLDFIPANGESAVEVRVTSAGKPVSAELYASVGELPE